MLFSHQTTLIYFSKYKFLKISKSTPSCTENQRLPKVFQAFFFGVTSVKIRPKKQERKMLVPTTWAINLMSFGDVEDK
jgi:hypothetical protein